MELRYDLVWTYYTLEVIHRVMCRSAHFFYQCRAQFASAGLVSPRLACLVSDRVSEALLVASTRRSIAIKRAADD